jgi:hypothetical protein
MRHPMSLKARRELLASTAVRYQKASKKEKQNILSEFTLVTGYHRKYAIGLLKGYAPDLDQRPKPKREPHARKYDMEVQTALIAIWEAANCICSKRLVPFMPEMVAKLEKYGYLRLSEGLRAHLLTMSASTVDRLLYPVRLRSRARGIGTTKPGALIKSQVPIRSFSDWDDDRPGFMEADLVAHCGTFTGGHFLQTLVMTDIATSWTEFAVLLFGDQANVLQAIGHLREQIPFALLGLDTDNGSEFLNYLLLGYCFDEEITFTRSRPYKKNDQCYVEQKNGSIIRKFVGYDRFEGILPAQILSALYGQLPLFVNFFQPTLKLISKTRKGSRVIKKYDRAQTPYQRILASESVPEITKQKLTEQYQELDPVQLLEHITRLQDLLWQQAYVEREMTHRTNSSNPAHPKMARDSTSPPDGPSQENTNPPHAKLEMVERMYRRTKKKRRDGQGKRWWRTRTDPFAEVWEEVEQELEKAPYSNAKTLFEKFQKRYPGKFLDGQLRTFQRRVKDWRVRQANMQPSVEALSSNPFSVPKNGELG